MDGRFLLDVNVLIALFDPNHPDCVAARQWAGAQTPLRWASCPLTQNGFLRISTQPRYSSPIPLRMAVERLEGAIEESDHDFWPDDFSMLDIGVVRCKHLLGHQQLTDAYLLALAVRRGGRLVTFDRAVPVEAVVGAGAEHVVKLEN